jgi:hypothetical protein
VPRREKFREPHSRASVPSHTRLVADVQHQPRTVARNDLSHHILPPHDPKDNARPKDETDHPRDPAKAPDVTPSLTLDNPVAFHSLRLSMIHPNARMTTRSTMVRALSSFAPAKMHISTVAGHASI